MDRAFLARVVGAVVLLGVGVAAGVYLGNTGAFDDRPRVDPAVTGVYAENVTCVADPEQRATVATGNTTRGSFLSLTADLPLSDGHVPPTNASIAETGLANYTIAIGDRQADDAPTCTHGTTPVATVRVDFEVPHPGVEPFEVTVTYGGEPAFRVRNGPEGVRVLTEMES